MQAFSPTKTRSLITHAFICVALVSATFAALGPVLDNGLVNWDDPVNFIDNEHVRGLSLENLRWMWTTGHMGHYQPLTWMTVGLDYALSGRLDPRTMHRTSLIIHAANVLLFYALCVALLVRAGNLERRAVHLGAGLAALLFAVHPLRVESVAWATERRDVVSGIFFLLALLSYVRFASAHHGRARTWFVMSVMFFVCAVLSKVICVTLVGVILVLDVYPLRRIGGDGRWRGGAYTRVWLEKIPFAVVSLIASAGAFLAQGTGVLGLAELSIGERLANTAIALWFYPLKFVWPVDLIPIYHLHWKANCFDPLYVGCALGVLAVTVILLVYRRRFPAGLAVWVIYLMMVSPVLSLTQNGFQFAADRYTYLVLMGFCVLVGGGLAWCVWRVFREPSRSALMLVVAIAVGTVLIPLTRRQTELWHDSITLWEAVLRVNSESWTAHQNLGKALMETGEVRIAADHFRIAQEKYAVGHHEPIELPGDLARRAVELAGGDTNAILDAGSAMMESRNWDTAIEIYRLGAEEHPESAEIHRALGDALVQKGDELSALRSFRRALELETGSPAHYRQVVDLLLEMGRFEEANATLREALGVHPDWREGARLIEETQERILRRDAEQRVDELTRRLSTDLGNMDDRSALADALAEAGQFSQAVAAYESVLERRPEDAQARLQLARCFAALGEFERAIEALRAGVNPYPAGPESVEIAMELSQLLSMAPLPKVRNGDEAVRLAEWAVQQSASPTPRALGILANAYAEAGRIEEAQRTCNEAVAAAQKLQRPNVARFYLDRLEHYRAGRAVHSSPSTAAAAEESVLTDGQNARRQR